MRYTTNYPTPTTIKDWWPHPPKSEGQKKPRNILGNKIQNKSYLNVQQLEYLRVPQNSRHRKFSMLPKHYKDSNTCTNSSKIETGYTLASQCQSNSCGRSRCETHQYIAVTGTIHDGHVNPIAMNDQLNSLSQSIIYVIVKIVKSDRSNSSKIKKTD